MSAPGNLEEDRRLVEAAKAGDAAAFEAIYDANAPFVLRVALRLGLERADAHDVVQESFLYLVRKLPTLVLTARIGTLLYTVARHAALKKKKSPHLLPVEDCDALGPPDEACDPAHRLDARERVALLPPAQREVVELRYFEEFSIDEIAAALEVPPGTVKSRLHHALLKMRRE